MDNAILQFTYVKKNKQPKPLKRKVSSVLKMWIMVVKSMITCYHAQAQPRNTPFRSMYFKK